MKAKCPVCGKRLKVSDGLAAGEAICPDCHAPISRTASGESSKTCPQCNAQMDAKAVLCVKCGYDLRARRTLSAAQGAADQRTGVGGESGSLGLRAIGAALVWVGLAAIVAVILLATSETIDRLGWILLLALGVVCTLLLGSFTRITLTVAEEAKWLIGKTTFLCFVPVTKRSYDPSEYDALYTSYNESPLGSRSLTGALFLLGCLCGGLLIFRGNPDVFTLTLGRDVVLYRGHREDEMRKLIALIQGATGLPCKRGGNL